MIVEFDKSFAKSLNELNNKSLHPKIERIIDLLESAHTLSELQNVKKISGYKLILESDLEIIDWDLKKLMTPQ